MKIHRFTLAFVLAVGLSAQAAETATVKRNKVNVRGQASMTGEVITQLEKGETVALLEEIPVTKPKKGDPTAWARIALPANTPVWVFAPYIETSNNTVNVRRVNFRGGPGENYSVLGRIERGSEVKPIRTVNGWMEIEAPTNAFAFVAMEYLEKTTPEPITPPPSEPAVAAPAPAPTPPVTTPTAVETMPAEPTPVPATDTPPAAATSPAPVPAEPVPDKPATPEPAATFPQTETPSAAAPMTRRIVIREGRVVYSRSIQAPTQFALESLETHRLINYLHTEQVGLKLKPFAGRKVSVTGEELVDHRWANIPILEVEDIRIVP